MLNFRREVDGHGLSSYPHPWLMPDFWQFPTVSMGLGPIMAIYQARFMKYLEGRGLAEMGDRKVWAFMGDGEMDEPESLGAISLAAREKLDNLIFVVNCNLQRLDGPVRGNGKIIQELEADFRGAGWNVIKVIWGSNWDALLARDKLGLLRKRMEECVDGEYQAFKSRDGAYVRKEFFAKYPELLEMVSGMTDDEVWQLRRGGHDPIKVYAAYAAAVSPSRSAHGHPRQDHQGLRDGRRRRGHEHHPSAEEDGPRGAQGLSRSLQDSRDRRPDRRGAVLSAGRGQRRDSVSARAPQGAGRQPAAAPAHVGRRSRFRRSSAFDSQLKSTGDREVSTTMAFVRILSALVRDKNIGNRVVPIVPDESRTFGMEGMFRQLGIFSQVGQLYKPEDSGQLMFYREYQHGQILQEGINEAGAMSSWIAAATSYSTHNLPMIPFYIFYSMFGFQRVGDLAWAAGDSRCRGFLLGGTSGRTTLNGEGLQHADGHSHVLASIIPNCVAYDPTYAYELAVIIHDGLRRMLAEQEDVFYYITLMNENYVHPAMPEGAQEGILKGMYPLTNGGSNGKGPRVQLLGSGTILREAIAAADLLRDDFGVAADVWSVPSFTELRRDGIDVERWNMLHPTEPQRRSYVETCLADRPGPVVAATDYIRAFADQIRPYVPRRYRVLGTDGFGRSDYRERLRSFFEIDRHYITVAALSSLADEEQIPASRVDAAIKKYDIDPEKPNPATV